MQVDAGISDRGSKGLFTGLGPTQLSCQSQRVGPSLAITSMYPHRLRHVDHDTTLKELVKPGSFSLLKQPRRCIFHPRRHHKTISRSMSKRTRPTLPPPGNTNPGGCPRPSIPLPGPSLWGGHAPRGRGRGPAAGRPGSRGPRLCTRGPPQTPAPRTPSGAPPPPTGPQRPEERSYSCINAVGAMHTLFQVFVLNLVRMRGGNVLCLYECIEISVFLW